MSSALRSLLLFVVSLLATRCCFAETAGSSRDLTLALFTAHPVSRVVLTPAGPGAWIASCAGCPHRPLRAPLTLAMPGEIFASGRLRVQDPTSGLERTTAGLWHLRALLHQSAFDITVQVPSEQYVAAVLNAEAAPEEPGASLRALAIVARTYALNGRHYTAAPGHLPGDLCDSTACQALRLAPASTAIQQAVRETAGETLWFGGKRAEVFFSQHCGGVTEEAGAIAPRLRGTPYLTSHADPYCMRQGPAAWHADLPLHDLYALATAEGWNLPHPLTSISAATRSSSGRVLNLRLSSEGGRTLLLPAVPFRLAVGRALGWNVLRSDLYQVSVRRDLVVFDGRGHGHGVGLCQAGAQQMAHEGKCPREILSFYFPGTQVRLRPDDAGWNFAQGGPVTLQTLAPLTVEQNSAVSRAWNEASRRFPLIHEPSATVIFAPFSELFRQLTHQPGWDLASTQGDLTVLQPLSLLASNRTSLEGLLLHEFLHQRVEAEASDRAPLWLREGLVEVLAGEAARSGSSLPAAAIDSLLQQADSRAQAQVAHRAAGSLVQLLEHRYTPSAVRGWLLTGVPESVTP